MYFQTLHVNYNLYKCSRVNTSISKLPHPMKSVTLSKTPFIRVTSAKTRTKDIEPKCTKTGLHVCSDIMLPQTKINTARALQLHSRHVYRKLNRNHKTHPKKSTPNPAEYHSCNTISHPNSANCPLTTAQPQECYLYRRRVNYQKTTDDTGKPL